MKLISWNVNGLRACVQKGFLDQFHRLDADFFCLQETKMQPGQLELDLPGYLQYWHSAEKKGYSGTAVFTKHVPLSVCYGLDDIEPDTEGRVITLEYPEFYLVNCYTPNAQRGLARIDFRMRWDEAFRQYLARLDEKKPVIVCGDLNVAHQEIDLKNPGANRGNAGFSDQERESFTKTLATGFTDTFRYLHPDTVGAYTWWSYMFNARQNNAGWRIDYFLVSDRKKEAVYAAPIYSDILGSDHCPVGLEIDLSCNGSIWMEKTFHPVKTPEKEKIAGKTVVKMCALGLAALGLIAGIARIRPAESMQTEEPSQPQVEVTAPTTEKTGMLSVSVLKETPKWKNLDNPTYRFEMTIDSEKFLLGNTFTPSAEEAWNCWAFLEINYAIGSSFNNSRCNIGIAEELCGSAMAARGTELALNSCRVFRQDGTPAGWIVFGNLTRSTGIRVNLSLSEGVLTHEFVLTPRFNSAQALEMSTEALADYAAHLDAFKEAKGGMEFYRERAKNDPALAELEKRTDAGDWIAVITDKNPELKSSEFLKSVFPQVESVNLRSLSQAEANGIDIKRLVWLVLQDQQLAEEILPLAPNLRYSVWSNSFCELYPAFRRMERKGKNELLEYLYSYQGTQTQELAAALYYFGSNMSSGQGNYYHYKVEEAKYFLRVVTEEEARNMTTGELVERATGAYLYGTVVMPNFSSSAVVYPSGMAGEESSYLSLREEFAVLRELERREDAADCLFDLVGKAKDGDQLTCGWFFLRQHVYVEKMNPEQVEIMVLQTLGGSAPSYASTHNLVKCVLQYVMPVAGEAQGWYERIFADYPVVRELAMRGSAAEEVFRYINGTLNGTQQNRKYAARLLDRAYYRNQMTEEIRQQLESLLIALITQEEAAEMTTAQLAKKVTSISELLSTTTAGNYFYEDYFTDTYSMCQKNYAVIQEVEKRQDAVAELLLDLGEYQNHDIVRSRLIVRILGAEPYQQKMTPEQAEMYVGFWEDTINDEQKISQMDTNTVARICLSLGFWERELSGLESAEEAESAYRKLRQVFSPLVELQNRKDFTDELLFFLDPANLSVTQTQRDSAKVLLCLDFFYSRLTGEQQIMMAQMLLGTSFADGGVEKTEPAVDPGNIPLA